MDKPSPTILSLSLLALITASRLLYTYTLARKIPGPRIAAITDFWLFAKFWRGGNWKEISVNLHEQYGPVVRVGPKRVIFSKADAVPVIFSTRDVMEKAESYDTLLAMANGKEVASLITIRPETRHTAVKRALGPIFTQQAVLSYEDHVDATVALLEGHLNGLCKNGPAETDLFEWLMYFAFDTLSRIAFNQDLGFMTHRKDVDGAFEGARQRFAHWHYWLPIPWLERLLFKNRLAIRASKPSQLVQLAVQKITERKKTLVLSDNDIEKAKSQLPPHPDLLQKYLAASAAHPQILDTPTVIGITVSTIHAGADTTANTMALAMYHLLRNPSALAKLREELSASPSSKFAELNKLPYLHATILETLRLTPTAHDATERTVPSSPSSPTTIISGTPIPAGTTVSVSQHVLYRDPDVFGAHPDEFRPERWVEASEDGRRSMERAQFFFSAGKRRCTGEHVAWLEMKRVIPMLVNKFGWELVRPDPRKGEEVRLSGETVAGVEEVVVRVGRREV
jgi:cytochrome P450